jgi:putative oxidoreductase
MLRDLGTLLARSAIGASFAAHGAQKAFGWFGGPGLAGAAGFMDSLRFRPGARYAILSSYTELAGGTLLALGLGGPLGPAAMIAVMTVAGVSVHGKNGFFAQNGGYELPALYAVTAGALAMSGPGRFSLDEALGLDALADERIAWLAVTGGVVGGLLALASRAAEASSTDAAA